MTPRLRLLVAFLTLFAATPAAAETLLVVAGTIHTSGPEGSLENAAVLIVDGEIHRVGARAAIDVPADARVLEAAVVTPGLIDTHSVVGLAGQYNVPADQDADETTDPNQAGLRAIDGFNPREPLLGWLLANGVTVIQAGPGEANPIGGLAGVFKTGGATLDESLLRFPSALVFTLGEAPKRTYGEEQKAPVTRMGTASIIRAALAEAQDYERKRGGGPLSFLGGKGKKTPDRDLGKEALGLVLSRQIPALFTARREDDLLTALRIGEEFGLQVELADAAEAYLVAEEIASAGVPVHVGPVLERQGALETMNASLENAAFLQRHGVPLTFQSGFESYVPKTHVVLLEAAVAAANGLGFEAALRALTIDAARRLGVEKRVGSIEPGKDADLVLFEGDPFEYTTRVDAVILDGRVAWSRR